VHILALESAVVLVITPESESFFMTPEPILSRCSSGWVQCPPPPSVPPADRKPTSARGSYVMPALIIPFRRTTGTRREDARSAPHHAAAI
jgi:hypothetical protein